ncbi:MAG: ribonuclease III [Actinomycetota bacterium]
MTTAEASALEHALGVRFADGALLDLALAHRSWAFEAGGQPTNERLEFLGDAVLGLVITDRVYRALPEASEGRLAKLRAATVSATTLASVARGLGVGEAVKLGRGEEQSGGRDKDSILADTLEALIGAVYLDRGLDEATGLVHRLFDGIVDELRSAKGALDFKTALQELSAAELSTLPAYELSEEGPDHEKRFTAVVRVGGEALGSGQGRSKKEAEQAAARQALDALAARPGAAG